MKRLFLFLVFLLAFNMQGQNINDYKYVIVPTKFDFQRSENEYRLSTVISYHLTQMGFKTFYDTDQLPLEVAQNNCSRLNVALKKYTPFLSTRFEFMLIDCQKNVVFKGEGSSKEKEFKTAYVQAVERAMEGLYAKGYSYNGNKAYANAGSGSNTTQVEPAAKTPTGDILQDLNETDVLYAQSIEGGFQVVNSVPKVLFKIFKTSSNDIFLATIDTYEGVLVSKNGKWILEFKKDGQVISKTINIKF